jgi:hypothetical protein
MKHSVKQTVFNALNTELESGRMTLTQLLNPNWGQCQDFGLFITGLVSYIGTNYGTVRPETVNVYIRSFKAKERRKLSQAKTTI